MMYDEFQVKRKLEHKDFIFFVILMGGGKVLILRIMENME